MIGRIAAIAMFAASATASAQPARNIIETCLKAESDSPETKYVEASAKTFESMKDESSEEAETTLRIGDDNVGVWMDKRLVLHGLVFNESRVPLGRVVRLSKEKPVPFNPYLADWAIVSERKKSYLCITFNFEGLGQSGTYQSVRGVYLIDKVSRPLRAYYTVGRVTSKGVTLAK